MPEVLLFVMALFILVSPQLIAGFMAKSMGRDFWFWFWISFLIPIISIFILVHLTDKNPNTQIKLADHVKRGH
jgi:hypothetical protein